MIYVSDWNDQKKKIGDSCWKGESVIELPDLAQMKALGKVHEADAGRVEEGQRVTLRLDAHPEDEFTGKVASIWRTVERETWRSPKKVVRLEVELDETDPRAHAAGHALPRQHRGRSRRPPPWSVDADAVFLEQDGPVVYRRTLMGHEAVPVELGRRNDEPRRGAGGAG